MRLAPEQSISAKKKDRYTALYTGLIQKGRLEILAAQLDDIAGSLCSEL